MKISKKQIKKNTISREVSTGVFGRHFTHKCRIKDDSIKEHYGILFEMEVNNPTVYAHLTQNTEVIGDANNKAEFIQVISDYLND